jgi:hypothetical protein
MAVRLLPISVLYILLQLAPMSLNAAYSAGLSRSMAVDYYSDALFSNYWIILFTPLTNAVSVPDLGKNAKTCSFFGEADMLLVQKH